MFQVFSQLEEIKKPLYNLVSKELGYSSTSEFEKVIAKKMKEFAIKNPGKNVSELYDNAIKELLPGENIFFKDFFGGHTTIVF